MNRISIAIDGPGGAGKSTVAKALAGKYGFAYVDTGAIYRTIGLAVLRADASPTDEEQVEPVLSSISVDLDYDETGLQHMLLNGQLSRNPCPRRHRRHALPCRHMCQR